MFRKSRKKIVAAIMFVLICLFLGTLAVIYASSYYEVSSNNYEMLQRHAQMYSPYDQMEEDQMPPGVIEPIPNSPITAPGGIRFEDQPAFQLSTFYSVAFAADGTVLTVDAMGGDVYSEKALISIAQEILEGEKTQGVQGSLIFLVMPRQGFTLVAFMDNTMMRQSMTTLFRYTLIFGGLMLLALYFLARYLAKRIVDPLEENHRRQKQFISDAGHELKTPISVVNANADMLQRQIGENQWLSNIQYENERMGALVGQLLELARAEDVAPQKQRLDFSRLVAGDVLPFEVLAFEQGLTLELEVAENIFVEGDSSQLSQLVSILVDNAITHSSGGTQVRISLTETKTAAQLSVINSASPIPNGQEERLFQRFYRVDEARNSESGHYGLGLAIAKAIVTAHGGKIEVKCRDDLVEFRTAIPKSK